jgi:hypothetical protein
MKKLFVFASALVFSTCLFAQESQTTQATPEKKATDVIKFKDLSFDFGKIKQGTPVSHEFNFVNISDAPVIIESTMASCGCTTPVKPLGAIPKGKEDRIKVEYNASAGGGFKKTVTVKVAGIAEPVTLTISGTVISVDEYAKLHPSS